MKRKNKQYVKRFFAWALGNKKKELENFLSKKNELVNNALIKLTKEVDSEINMYRDKIDTAIKKIENEFEKNIQNLQKLIITEAGLDF